MHNQPLPSRRIGAMLTLAALACGGLLLSAAPPEFTADGHRLVVRTERYEARFDGLALVHLENRLTGETYAAQGTAEGFAGGVAIESLRPGVPNRLYEPAEGTEVASTASPTGASVTFLGLRCGDHFDPGLTAELALAVDPATGDLLVRPAVRAVIEQIHGVRDRGVLNIAVGFGAWAETLRLVIPASDGFSVGPDNVAEDWRYHARWPQSWEAALLIAESATGSLGVWADESELRYGRQLTIGRRDGWNVSLTFETADRIERCTELRGATWRLNVFAGNWLQPAARYREQCARQWPDLIPIKGSQPAWAERIRIFITGPTPDPANAARFAALVPRDTLAVFTAQEWLRGWNEGDIAKLNKGMDYFPNWPLDNPDRYEARPDMPDKFRALEEMGLRIFPYTNPTIVTHQHPWKQKLGGRHMFAHRIWQRLHPELCADLVGRYGVSGIYEDCSWVIGRHSEGEPDGFNWYNGSAAMRQYFRELLPATAVCGERNNEVTWRGQRFALSITQWPQHAHPIVTYLCEPYLRMWNLQLQPTGFDADDIRGWLTPWPFVFEEAPMQERRILRERGIVAAREQLESVWPETWAPEAMHYFRAANGDEYRFVRDCGTRFVKMTPGGPETIYWRLGGVREAELGEMGIEGWIGYAGDRAVGLNPKAVYPVFDGVARPYVVVAELPAGYSLRPCALRDGFWSAMVVAEEAQAPAREVTLKLRAAAGVPIRGVCGAKSFRRLSESEAEVVVQVPGGFGVYWIDPTPIHEGNRLTAQPTFNTVLRRDTGLSSHLPIAVRASEIVQQTVGKVEDREEGSLAWLLTVPEFSLAGDDRLFLQFAYGSQHPYGDGANYSVRIDGRTVWKRYRPEQGKPDPRTNQPQPLPLARGQVNLQPYAGQTVVLELVADGHQSSVSESIRWHSPRLSTEPDHTAESDEADAPATPTAPGALLLAP